MVETQHVSIGLPPAGCRDLRQLRRSFDLHISGLDDLVVEASRIDTLVWLAHLSQDQHIEAGLLQACSRSGELREMFRNAANASARFIVLTTVPFKRNGLTLGQKRLQKKSFCLFQYSDKFQVTDEWS